MKRAIRFVGYAFLGLVALGLTLRVLLALRTGQPFYGINYRGVPLGTYSTLLALIMAGGIGIVRLAQVRRRRTFRDDK